MYDSSASGYSKYKALKRLRPNNNYNKINKTVNES